MDTHGYSPDAGFCKWVLQSLSVISADHARFFKVRPANATIAAHFSVRAINDRSSKLGGISHHLSSGLDVRIERRLEKWRPRPG